MNALKGHLWLGLKSINDNFNWPDISNNKAFINVTLAYIILFIRFMTFNDVYH